MKPIKHIDLTFTESPYFVTPKRFESWEEAESFLGWHHVHRAPEHGGYYKTDFTITFDDGAEYNGRYDIGCDHPSLREHIIAFSRMVVGRTGFGRYATDEQVTYYLGILQDLDAA